jgi:hypothetical protein
MTPTTDGTRWPEEDGTRTSADERGWTQINADGGGFLGCGTGPQDLPFGDLIVFFGAGIDNRYRKEEN